MMENIENEEQKELDFQNEILRRNRERLDKEFKKLCKAKLGALENEIQAQTKLADSFAFQIRKVYEFMGACNIDEEDDLRAKHNDIYTFLFKVKQGLEKANKCVADLSKKRDKMVGQMKKEFYDGKI